MPRHKVMHLLAQMVVIALLSGCGALEPLDENIEGDFGPEYTVAQHQLRTLDALWRHLESDYVYYDGGVVDWESLQETYRQKVEAGLTSEEFSLMIDGLETELPGQGLLYQSRDERIETQISDASTYAGIGVAVAFAAEPEPHIVVLYVFEGSPADNAGLKAHDSIFAVDGDRLAPGDTLAAVDRIRGPAGTTVSLGVQSPGTPERTVEITRAGIDSTVALETSIIEGTDIGYVLFPPSAYDALMDELLESIRSLATNRKLTGLILDLRVARATNGWPLEEMLTLFHDGVIGEFYNQDASQLLQVAGENVLESQTIPLVILVGENTRGFAEILAASLQDGGRATIVGGVTPGEVEIMSSYYLPDGSHVGIQSASFRLPDGQEIGLSGITPDIAIDAGWGEVVPGADPLLEAALTALEVQQ